jgi:hypothetical protein
VTLPPPRPGAVIRYAFLWSDAARRGATEAAKDRPCAIVLAVRRTPEADLRVVVAPVTHSPPRADDGSIEIPPEICAALGLDGGRHWLRVDEVNVFAWPGFDLRPLPGRPGVFEYGMLPRELYERLRAAILARQAAHRLTATGRD